MSRNHWTSILVIVAVCAGVSGHLHAEPTALSPSALPVPTSLTVTYDPNSGRVIATAPDGSALTAFELRSESGAFDGSCDNLSGPFDVCTPSKVFKLDTNGFPSIDFGEILPTGMSGEWLLGDLRADGASKGGGFATGNGVFLVHADFVPEPMAGSLFLGGALMLACMVRHGRWDRRR